jgi:translation initiation factor 2 subunit 3
MVGHVAHGKTTLVESLTGKVTLTHSEELKRGITIRLGYADASFYKCENGHYTNSKKCPVCFKDCELIRTVSFVDAPGHETLMATVLTGTALMDGAILVIASNEKCPQPQTREHLTALEAAGIKNVVIVQTKIDLVSEQDAIKSYKEIKQFVKGTSLENAPIVPVSAQQRINIDSVIETIEKTIPTPSREDAPALKMLVARSFDINKPGTEFTKLSGGILGGAILNGKLKIGDEIEIKPGIRIGTKYKPLTTKVVGLQKAGIDMEEAGPGGLLGVMTTLDPFLTKSDSLVGNIVGFPGKLPETRDQLCLSIELLERVVGLEKTASTTPLKIGEDLMINVGTARSIGSVVSMKKEKMELKLKIPVCIDEKERIVISRQISGRWRLIGFGTIC